MDTSRLNEVKAPPHDGTPRSHFRRVFIKFAVGEALSVLSFVEAVDGSYQGLLERIIKGRRVLVCC